MPLAHISKKRQVYHLWRFQSSLRHVHIRIARIAASSPRFIRMESQKKKSVGSEEKRRFILFLSDFFAYK